MNIPRLLASVAALVLLQTTAIAAFAQGAAAPPPPPPPPEKHEPLPEIPPPPGVVGDSDLEPQVTITRKEGETVEEARINGRLVWLKVTPRHGRPYFLIPDAEGHFSLRQSLDSGLKVPLWLLFEF